jgi:hypothetical protein
MNDEVELVSSSNDGREAAPNDDKVRRGAMTSARGNPMSNYWAHEVGTRSVAF